MRFTRSLHLGALGHGRRRAAKRHLTATPARPAGLRFIRGSSRATIARLSRALLSAGVATLAAGAVSAPAQGSPSLTWSSPTAFDPGRAPSAVSCASELLCAAVDNEGDALTTVDPTVPTWTWGTDAIDAGGRPLTAVSCAPESLCAAVDAHGNVFVDADPGSSSWSRTSLEGEPALTGISCPNASLCVAVDQAGEAWTSASPGSGSWAHSRIDADGLTAVSCSTASLCVAVDDAGNVLSSVDPAGGAWRTQRIDFGELIAVSCASQGLCVALDASGNALSSDDAGVSPATWSETPIDGERLSAVSCASSGTCVAVDRHGDAAASDDPGAATPTWSSPASIDSEALVGVSCLPGGFCMALDTAGRLLLARVPAPTVTTETPTQVTSSTAVLAGMVSPNDAVLATCRFEYGTSTAYGQSLPCSPLPAASGGPQGVSASLAGLAANVTYHYRLLASSPAGTAAGEDVAFTTAVSSQVTIVTPSPSIAGTPAVGQRLACHPGTPVGAAVRLSYVWLRDLIPIAGSTGSTYTVVGQDSGHHLQCEVTASDAGGSATAKSAFVTVPVGGVPASAGETSVGSATYASGRVEVPITCSPRASGGCEVALRLQAVETLSGRRIVAIAARAVRRARGSAAALRHRTIALASVRVHVAPGAHATVTVALGATARRLLAARRRFSAYLYVSGTVIGVLEAQLARELLTLTVPARGAAVRAAHRPSHGAHRR
jgi:YD repeat-containing protein